MLNYAVDRLTALPNTSVYLDGTHSGWLNVGDITDRLLKAGVERGGRVLPERLQLPVDTEPRAVRDLDLLVHRLRHRGQAGRLRQLRQPVLERRSSQQLDRGGLDPAKIWSDTATDPTANTAGINSRYDLILGDVQPTKSS